jgi:adenylylsulfate kinase-like enzyme
MLDNFTGISSPYEKPKTPNLRLQAKNRRKPLKPYFINYKALFFSDKK